MDRGAWWATDCGVAKSWTQLSDGVLAHAHGHTHTRMHACIHSTHWVNSRVTNNRGDVNPVKRGKKSRLASQSSFNLLEV